MTRRKLPVSSFLRPCPDCGARWRDRELTHAPSCPAGRSLDAVTQDDARWFEDHPGEQTRVRPVTHAEIVEWGHLDGVQVFPNAQIVVHQLAPGFRTRSLLWTRIPAQNQINPEENS